MGLMVFTARLMSCLPALPWERGWLAWGGRHAFVRQLFFFFFALVSCLSEGAWSLHAGFARFTVVGAEPWCCSPAAIRNRCQSGRTFAAAVSSRHETLLRPFVLLSTLLSWRPAPNAHPTDPPDHVPVPSNLTNQPKAVYTAGVVLPTPLACCRYYHRSLNPKKLIEVSTAVRPTTHP